HRCDENTIHGRRHLRLEMSAVCAMVFHRVFRLFGCKSVFILHHTQPNQYSHNRFLVASHHLLAEHCTTYILEVNRRNITIPGHGECPPIRVVICPPHQRQSGCQCHRPLFFEYVVLRMKHIPSHRENIVSKPSSV